ncbi:LysR family transcriptional regulator [Bradyrhizobium sp. UFLA01-814]|uniref:LysR family transcriptional regulator n=1 Tax=Bradyrhizobium sp. UFLA01-814 TaxID=3023480 RepID=UPI00398ADF2B
MPIELVRTVIAIAETGSLSKASERLGLSQPAVSSQVKRLQSLLGGELFMKTANGTTVTDFGKLALQQARRILEANDQLLRLSGSAETVMPLRLGLSTVFVQKFLQSRSTAFPGDTFIQADHSIQIAKGVSAGYIDVACFYKYPAIEEDIDQLAVKEFNEPLVWIRARNFVMSAGAPLPILVWPGDDWMIRALIKHGVSFKIAFKSLDYHANLAAAEAGIGLTAVPESMIPSSVIRAKEYYLPALPTIKALLCVRNGLDSKRRAPMVEQLSGLFFESGQKMPGSN